MDQREMNHVLEQATGNTAIICNGGVDFKTNNTLRRIIATWSELYFIICIMLLIVCIFAANLVT